jgi:hypothetical protein
MLAWWLRAMITVLEGRGRQMDHELNWEAQAVDPSSTRSGSVEQSTGQPMNFDTSHTFKIRSVMVSNSPMSDELEVDGSVPRLYGTIIRTCDEQSKRPCLPRNRVSCDCEQSLTDMRGKSVRN